MFYSSIFFDFPKLNGIVNDIRNDRLEGEEHFKLLCQLQMNYRDFVKYTEQSDMRFSQDYCSFFDLQAAQDYQKERTRWDWMWNCLSLLETLGVPTADAHSISQGIYDLMSSSRRHYHTPVHVLSMFQMAKRHNVELTAWERLAIWFHDAIHYPDCEDNEYRSGKLMLMLLMDVVSNGVLQQAEHAIIATSKHLESWSNWRLNRILDLDLSMLTQGRESFTKQCQALRAEYLTVYDVDEYTIARKEFLEKLSSKPSIYRTAQFKKYDDSVKLLLKEEINATTVL